MSILDSTIAPYMVVLVVVAVLAGFFRKALIHLIVLFLFMTLLLALFPQLTQHYLNLIRAVNQLFH